MGKINQVSIVTDIDMEKSALGDTISFYFEASYPILTADEPIFDVRYMKAKELLSNKHYNELRTYVFLADLSDTASVTTKMVKDDLGEEKFKKALSNPEFTTSVGINKWADGQLIIYIFAYGQEKLAQAIHKHFELIAKKINDHDKRNLNATVYGIQDVNNELTKNVLDSFGLSIKIPGLFKKAISDKNFLWVRLDNKLVTQSLVFRKFKYVDKSQFKMDNIIKLRNEYGKAFIKTAIEDSYMSTNVIDLPTFEYSYFHNNVYVKEVRGIWETVNDFMGGPFVSYLLLNEAKSEVVFIDAFVYAPDREKRDLVQQLDCIVKTSVFPVVK
jgi:hypothetical protein